MVFRCFQSILKMQRGGGPPQTLFFSIYFSFSFPSSTLSSSGFSIALFFYYFSEHFSIGQFSSFSITLWLNYHVRDDPTCMNLVLSMYILNNNGMELFHYSLFFLCLLTTQPCFSFPNHKKNYHVIFCLQPILF